MLSSSGGPTSLVVCEAILILPYPSILPLLLQPTSKSRGLAVSRPSRNIPFHLQNEKCWPLSGCEFTLSLSLSLLLGTLHSLTRPSAASPNLPSLTSILNTDFAFSTHSPAALLLKTLFFSHSPHPLYISCETHLGPSFLLDLYCMCTHCLPHFRAFAFNCKTTCGSSMRCICG